MINNNPKTLTQLYEMLLYKKKDIIAIQKKLDISGILKRPGNANQLIVHLESILKGKILANSYKLLLELVEDLIPIQKNLNIDSNPILKEVFQNNKAFTDILFREIFNLLMYLEKDIIIIQKKLSIVSYFN